MKVARQRYRRRLISELKPHPKNPRRGDVVSIRESIRANDFVGAVIVQRSSDYILAGRHRVLAAEEEGATDVPVLEVDVDDDAALRILLADNRTSDRAEYDDSELHAVLKEIGAQSGTLEGTAFGIADFRALERELAALTHVGVSEDKPSDPPAEPISRRGEVYELGPHRLMCGDATSEEDAATLLAGDHAPLLFTSPPYLDARDYNGGQDLDVTHLARFVPTFASACDLLAINLGLLMREQEIVRYWDIYLDAAGAADLKLLAWNVWNREDATNLAAQTKMTFPTWHEWVFVFGAQQRPGHKTQLTKNAGAKPGRAQRGRDGKMLPPRRLTAGADTIGKLKRLGSVLTLPSHKGPTVGDHPATFPVGLPRAYLESLTEPGDLVVDPFGGTGTTLIAAEQIGRRAFLMELDPRYCDVIRDRYETCNGSRRRLASEGKETPARAVPSRETGAGRVL